MSNTTLTSLIVNSTTVLADLASTTNIADLSSSQSTSLNDSVSAMLSPIDEATINKLSAWLGLAILFGAMVFVLGFVVIYDRMIRKNFMTLLDENGDLKCSLNGSTDGVALDKTMDQVNRKLSELDSNVNDSQKTNSKRKRQQKEDQAAENDQIELKRF